MAQTLAQLQQTAASLQGQYSYAFANKPRATRRVDTLDSLIKQTETLLSQLRVAGRQAGDLTKTVSDRLATYRSEREKIQQAQAAGPAAIEAAILATRANSVFFQYRRHFAGQNRATRDVALLEEMVALLGTLKQQYDGLAITYPQAVNQNDREVIDQNFTMYSEEVGRIREANKAGTIEEQASALASIANSQFDAYRVHFAGKARLSRRPALIARIINTLTWVQSSMEALRDGGLTVEFNTNNIGIVSDRLSTYRAEQVEIAAARASTSFEQLVDALATAANDIMKEYSDEFAGKSRATRDLKKLTDLYDRMFEVERQMNDLTLQFESTTNLQNLYIVQDALMVYATEYDAIEKAKAEGKV